MSNELATLMVALMGIIVTILLAAIPYAYVQGSRFKGILSALEHGSKRMSGMDRRMDTQDERLDCHGESINDHETRITVVEDRLPHRR